MASNFGFIEMALLKKIKVLRAVVMASGVKVALVDPNKYSVLILDAILSGGKE